MQLLIQTSHIPNINLTLFYLRGKEASILDSCCFLDCYLKNTICLQFSSFFQMAASTPGGSEVADESEMAANLSESEMATKLNESEMAAKLSEELGDAIGFLEVQNIVPFGIVIRD